MLDQHLLSPQRSCRYLALLTCALGLSCSSNTPADNSTGGSGGAAGSAGSGGSGAAPGLTGAFNVEFRGADPVTGAEAYSFVRGQVHDGPVPETMPLIPGPEEKGCRLYKPNIPF